jgi:hypothetical protein
MTPEDIAAGDARRRSAGRCFLYWAVRGLRPDAGQAQCRPLVNFQEGNMAKKTFEVWMAAVDAVLIRLCGLDSRDLPDACYHDWYEDGRSPLSAARKAIRCAEDS